MTTPILPDVDALVTKALRARLTGVRVAVDIPADWDASSALVVAHRVGGAAVDPRFLDRALIDVQVFEPDRNDASALARRARAALLAACQTQFSDGTGSLSGFREITGPWSSGPETHANISRFIATYEVMARPAKGVVL
ncbi:phage tail termination protein [Streptomyces sp. NPDC002644]